ncbi:RH-like protein [Tiliqua scincoides]|uniref:RH-like protein n=1 Tax=Tiliqua scincoides TaxID=71010 RepID=UPI003462F25F
MASQWPPSLRVHLPVLVLFLETAFILIFYFFASYDLQADISIYPAFQNVNVMVIFGFGFLLAFLKRYSLSSAGFGLLLVALGVQWALIVDGFLFSGTIRINLYSILTAIMSTTAVLVSAGATLGKANPIQLACMAVVEVTVFTVSRWIAVEYLKVESHVTVMYVHIFGTYFGVMVSWMLYGSSQSPNVEKERSKPVSDMFAMLGTLFLWMFWPTFNSVLIKNEAERKVAVYNTYFAIAASAVAAFVLSTATSRDGKLSMAHIRSATLAGGIALGFSAPTLQHPWIAMALGFGAGMISVLGLAFVQKRFDTVLQLHDTCGVHYTFGWPSLYGALAHIILIMIKSRGNLSQMGYSALLEIGVLSLSVSMALGAGLVTGFLLTCKLFKPPPVTKYFDDQAYWTFPHLAYGY